MLFEAHNIYIKVCRQYIIDKECQTGGGMSGNKINE